MNGPKQYPDALSNRDGSHLTRDASALDADDRPWTLWARSLALLVALGLGLLLIVARRLEPDPRGYGTHERLGLGPCSFRALTGLPCPSCGMTTSYARLLHGDGTGALRANPVGAFMAVLSLPLCGWLLLSAAAGRALGVRRLDRLIVLVIVALCGSALGTWLVRIVFMRFKE